MIIRGGVDVLKASTLEIPHSKNRKPDHQIYAYLEFLYTHHDEVDWSKVPYANKVKNYLSSIR